MMSDSLGGGFSNGDNDINERCDADLLDALLGTEEVGTIETREVEAKLTPNRHKKSFPALSRLFMIGGSLFSRHRMGVVSRSCATRLRGSRFSWLDYSSIYCPFTRQFVSLRSPHWAHLVSAGFGIDSGLQHGRRVVLVRQGRLLSLASILQRCHEAPQGMKSGGKDHSPKALWSPLLWESLGVLLETTPLEDKKVLVQRVRAVLDEESHGRMGRRIPLGFYDSKAREQCSFVWSESTVDKDHTADEDDVHNEKMMAFGERCLEQILPWRMAVLQRQRKVTSQVSFSSAVGSINFSSSSPIISEKVVGLIERHSSLNSTPFMIPYTRMAYLSVAFDSKLPLIETAVDAVLRLYSPENILYCPLEHCIDFNTLMDVNAYKLSVDGGGAVELRNSIPVLHVGMHATNSGDASPDVIVIVGNAHLLSKCAIARLLDQWTRNGVLHGASKHQRRKGTRNKWGLLLGGSDPMRILSTGASVFGSVRALFIGYRSSTSFQQCQDSTAGDGGCSAAQIFNGKVALRVLNPTPEVLFSLDEPLIAALRRVSSIFQDAMSVAERKSFIEELCEAASRVTMVSSCCHSKPQGMSCCTGNVMHRDSTDDVGDDEGEDMLLQFQEACEAFLTHPLDKRDSGLLQYEHLLLRYPRFAAMRVRHNLLREYPLSIEFLKSNDDQPVTSLPSFVLDSLHEIQCSSKRHITLFKSRCVAQETAEADHDALKQQYAVSLALRHVRESCAGRHDGSSCPSVKDSSGGTSALLSSLEQKYDPFFEPPVLLGCWTRTFFFCAPMVADMLPLRSLLHLYVTASVELTGEFEVLDVDVFHVDYVTFPLDRRCRLFGTRLRFRITNSTSRFSSVKEGGAGECRVRDAATMALHHALARSAVEARLFPLWTHPLSRMRKKEDNCTYTSSWKGKDDSLDGFEAHFRFEALDECVSVAQPNIVERWLFALAVAQRGSMRLTVGSQVVALQDLSPFVSRGTWCRVVGFVPFGKIARVDPFSLSAKLQEQKTQPFFSAADIILAQRYFEQQRSANAVPVVCPIADGAVGMNTCAAETVVLPVATLVGGYRSLHYYALPTVQLPLLAPCQSAAASTLFHPLFAHKDSLMEFVSMESRAEAAAMLLRPDPSSDFPGERSTLHTFFEDIVFEEKTTTSVTQQKDCDASIMLHCDALSALSLFPLKRV